MRRNGRTLLVGAGSGRDIASALLVREQLRHTVPRVDLAGFLTPWALHEFDGKLEKPINRLTGKGKKFLVHERERALDSFFEPLLPELNKELDLGVDDIYLFSLQYGTSRLLANLHELIKQREYQSVVVVDVGGDILADKEDYATILTPIVDLACLEIMSRLPIKIDVQLAVMAPGVCGEIGYSRMAAILNELQCKMQLRSVPYLSDSVEYQKFEKVNKEINYHTGSTSYTEQLIRKIMNYNEDGNYFGDFTKSHQLGGQEWSASFRSEIGREYFNRVYYFNLRQVRDLRRGGRMLFDSPLDAAIKARSMGVCGTEVDISTLAGNVRSIDRGSGILILTPCCYMNIAQRKEIICVGIDMMREGDVISALVHDCDTGLLRGVADISQRMVSDNLAVITCDKVCRGEEVFRKYFQ